MVASSSASVIACAMAIEPLMAPLETDCANQLATWTMRVRSSLSALAGLTYAARLGKRRVRVFLGST